MYPLTEKNVKAQSPSPKILEYKAGLVLIGLVNDKLTVPSPIATKGTVRKRDKLFNFVPPPRTG